MKLRIGTRGSRLALAQANEIAERLAAQGVRSELVPMVTSGDRGASAPLSRSGLKGLFVAEIVRALHEGAVDLAVHSAKDLPSEDPVDIIVGAVPERAIPFDVLVTRDGELPDGAVVGTSSLRRRAQLLRSRPALRVEGVRGNVDTRLSKLQEGEVDGLVLAAAGLLRLGVSHVAAEPLGLDEMVPAPGQGALAVQVREDDAETREALGALDHAESHAAFDAERSLVWRLGGGCALPLGAYARVEGDEVHLVAVVATADGGRLLRTEARAPLPEEAASKAATGLIEAGAEEILAAVRGAG
ncbi:MAG: hydroxymethylbilane synthase [Actinobacteria bacterium]|nr:hydroxymethylbilane synthase [Actinomycetota bacterium]